MSHARLLKRNSTSAKKRRPWPIAHVSGSSSLWRLMDSWEFLPCKRCCRHLSPLILCKIAVDCQLTIYVHVNSLLIGSATVCWCNPGWFPRSGKLRAIAQQHLRGREIPKNKTKKTGAANWLQRIKLRVFKAHSLIEIFVTEFWFTHHYPFSRSLRLSLLCVSEFRDLSSEIAALGS